VRKEDKRSESEATIKLFGAEGHDKVKYHTHDELTRELHFEAHNNFVQNELQPGSPYLIEFGPLFYDYLSLIVVRIRSKEGELWELKKLLDPVDT